MSQMSCWQGYFYDNGLEIGVAAWHTDGIVKYLRIEGLGRLAHVVVLLIVIVAFVVCHAPGGRPPVSTCATA